MIDVEVEMDGMELYGSQVVHVSRPSFRMRFDGIPIFVEFVNDGTETRWEVGPGENDDFRIRLKNFKSRQRVGRLKPIKVGEAEGVRLFLTFTVETLSLESDERVVTFNFYKSNI